MKKPPFVILALMALCLTAPVALTFQGCATTSNAPSPAQIAKVANTAQAITFIGVTGLLQAEPQYRPQLQLSRVALKTLLDASAGPITPAQLQNVLTNFPDLTTTNGNLYVTGGVVLWNLTEGYLVNTQAGTNANVYVRPVGVGIYNGLNSALGN